MWWGINHHHLHARYRHVYVHRSKKCRPKRPGPIEVCVPSKRKRKRNERRSFMQPSLESLQMPTTTSLLSHDHTLRRPNKLLPIIPLQQRSLILFLPLLDLEREILLQEIHRLEVKVATIGSHDSFCIAARTAHHLLILQLNDASNTENRPTAPQAHRPPSHS